MNDIGWRILDSLLIILDWYILYTFVENIAVRKGDRLKSILFSISLGGVMCVCRLMGIGANIRMLISTVLAVIFVSIGYELKTKKAILLSVFYSLLIIGMDVIGIVAVFYLHGLKNMGIIIEQNIYTIQAMFISKVAMYICVYTIIRLIKVYKDVPKEYFMYAFIPVTANIISIFVNIGNLKPTKILTLNSIMAAASTLLIIFATVISIIIIGKLVKESKDKVKYELVQEKLGLQYKYYRGIEEEQEKVRKLYHDMRNHISCIQLLANSEAANSYIKKIEEQLNGVEKYYDTGSHLVDIILKDKQKEAEDKKIEFIAELDFGKCDFIEMIDVTSLFSNLINNAIEACDKITDQAVKKTIKLKGTYINNFFVLCSSNSKTNKVQIVKDRFITDKEDASIHGLGIKNIKTAVYRYGGEVTITYTEEEFLVKVLIPLNQEKVS